MKLCNLGEEFFDQWVRLMLVGWFMPYYIMGNADEWMSLGITTNGMKPICRP